MSVLCRVFLLSVAWCLLGDPSAARAGLYYSGEEMAPLPSQWRGFLLDQRQLRNLLLSSSPLRQRYQKAADDLEKAGRSRKLSADETADLGALYVRLGKFNRAVEVLRAGQRQYPRHFHIAANLGTAFQLLGELSGAEACLREAVQLAPPRQRQAELYHLDLVRRRLREGKGAQDLDDLFGVRFVNDKGEYEPGQLAAAQRKKLPAEAVACAQRLALWLPADGRLLWLLAELAGAHGDVRTAAAIMDGCVTEFGLRSPALRRHRRLMRDAAGKLAKSGPTSRKEHEGHAAGLLKMRSPRPLLDRRTAKALPPIQPDGLNALPWFVVTQTSLDRRYRPTFPKYLRQLEGKRVSMTGYMQPLGDGQEMNSFLLIEYPVGCWYCETPELVAMVLVEMPPGQSHTFTREPVTVTGKLKLNATEPEDFLYAIRAAAVKR